MSQQHPDIERLLTAPEEAERVPAGEIPALLLRLASAQLHLAGLQAALVARVQTTASTRAAADDRLLTMEDVAERLHVPPAHAREMGRRHELPTVRVGRYIRVRESSLCAWVRQREEVDSAPARAYHSRPKRTGHTTARVVPLRQPEASR
jgi:excisionase family DNA binding protein